MDNTIFPAFAPSNEKVATLESTIPKRALAITGTSLVYIVSLLVAFVAFLNVSSCNIINLLRYPAEVTLEPILLVKSYIGNGWYV